MGPYGQIILKADGAPNVMRQCFKPRAANVLAVPNNLGANEDDGEYECQANSEIARAQLIDLFSPFWDAGRNQ